MAENTAVAINDSHLMIEPKLTSCPICNSKALRRRLIAQGMPIVSCDECGLLMRNPQPSDHTLGEIYSSDYFLGSDSAALKEETNRTKRLTADLYLDQIEEALCDFGYSSTRVKALEVGCGHGNLLRQARARGWEVSGLEYSQDAAEKANENIGADCVRVGTVESCSFSPGFFDVCIIADVIEHTRNPAEFLENVNRLLRPGGLIFIAVPSLDSLSARRMG